MRKVEVAILIFILCANKIVAQNLDLGSWNIVNLKYNYNEKWSVFGEAQLRSLKFYSDFHYYECKGGVNYSVQNNVKLTLGAGTRRVPELGKLTLGARTVLGAGA